jgi:alpha-beta hydrolase superfamily lysophospholipase
VAPSAGGAAGSATSSGRTAAGSAGSAAFAAGAPREVVTVREWPGLFHEIFNEPEQDAVLQAMTDWLAARVPQAAQTAQTAHA